MNHSVRINTSTIQPLYQCGSAVLHGKLQLWACDTDAAQSATMLTQQLRAERFLKYDALNRRICADPLPDVQRVARLEKLPQTQTTNLRKNIGTPLLIVTGRKQLVAAKVAPPLLLVAE